MFIENAPFIRLTDAALCLDKLVIVGFVGIALCSHGDIGVRAVDILKKFHGKTPFIQLADNPSAGVIEIRQEPECFRMVCVRSVGRRLKPDQTSL